MHAEYRILEVHSGTVLAQPLDGVRPVTLRIRTSSKYIENELIVVEPPASGSSGEELVQVHASRVDPTFIGGEVPKLVPLGEDMEHEFQPSVSFEEGEEFDAALELFRAGDYSQVTKRIREFIKRFPYHVDSYHHLGIIETDRGRRSRALKYFEMGYRIGLLSIPNDFEERLPWLCLENRPFLRAAHGYGLALEHARRHLEAAEVYHQILTFNPNDNQGIRYLLPSLYLTAKAPEKAREVLEQHGADGMNLFTRCLIEIQDGHRLEALRWLCRGLSYNLFFPELVLSNEKGGTRDIGQGIVMGSKDEAAEYLGENQGWQQERCREFLCRVTSVKPFAARLKRALELKASLDLANQLPAGDKRSRNVSELFRIFGDKEIPKILEDCRAAL